MNDVRASDGYLSAGQAIDLLDLILATPSELTISRLARNMAAIHKAPMGRSINTVLVFQSFGILNLVENQVSISNKNIKTGHELHENIAQNVARELVSRIEEHDAWSCLISEVIEDGLFLDSMLLPSMADGLGTWVTGFGVATRSNSETRKWKVKRKFASQFLEALKRLNQETNRKSKSANALALELKRQSELGELAEEWVLEYERKRLSSHPLASQIRRISVHDVSAGYDIVSFSSCQSLRHDRFIEVKSYSEVKRFYWSRNEIETAKEFGEKYCLYLVDRRQMDSDEYEPRVISGPSLELFEVVGSSWTVRAASFELVSKS